MLGSSVVEWIGARDPRPASLSARGMTLNEGRHFAEHQLSQLQPEGDENVLTFRVVGRIKQHNSNTVLSTVPGIG